MQAQRHQVEEGKVYIIHNGEPIELPIVNGILYIAENDQMTPLPMPDTGFGTININIVNNEVKQYKVESLYTKSEILRKG